MVKVYDLYVFNATTVKLYHVKSHSFEQGQDYGV